jgi:D-3-phosphoglycerate dehydrogenase / 2-oxoglutarate reductase
VRVVVTDHVFADLDAERAAIEDLGGELELAPSADEETLVEAASHADALLVCFAPVGARVIEAAARNGCKVIARYGIGVDNIDVEAATRAGIRVTNVPDYCIEEVADHTIALILLSARQLLAGIDSVRSGGWEMPHGRVHRVGGRRLALLGVGRIGGRVLERALALGLEVVGYDPFLREELPGLQRAASAEEAVMEADYVSLHAPLTPETRHLVGDPLIAAMRRAPYIVNTSRGGLVDAQAALRALDAGTLSGLALDVTEDEPLAADSPLRSHPKVIVTPHMAFYSVESERVLQQRAVDEVVRALQGRPAVSAVN